MSTTTTSPPGPELRPATAATYGIVTVIVVMVAVNLLVNRPDGDDILDIDAAVLGTAVVLALVVFFTARWAWDSASRAAGAAVGLAALLLLTSVVWYLLPTVTLGLGAITLARRARSLGDHTRRPTIAMILGGLGVAVGPAFAVAALISYLHR